MMLETKTETYRGVLCRHCRQPIPVPAIVISLETATEKDPEKRMRAFHLRCRACENEHMYRSADIADFEGTPRPRSSRGRSGRTPFRQSSAQPDGLAKAANG